MYAHTFQIADQHILTTQPRHRSLYDEVAKA